MANIHLLTEQQYQSIAQPKLLCEANYWFEARPDEIKANREKHGGNLVMTSCIQRANKKNQMGRIYPKHILEREFHAYQKLVDGKSAYGETSHPDTSVVDFPTTSHCITKQWSKISADGFWEWWANITLLNNRVGKDMQAIIEQGFRVSISSRGVGTTEHDNQQDADVVQQNLVMIAFDLVTQPSTHDANLIIGEALNVNMKEFQKNEYAYNRYMEQSVDMVLQKEGIEETTNNSPIIENVAQHKNSIVDRIQWFVNIDLKNRM